MAADRQRQASGRFAVLVLGALLLAGCGSPPATLVRQASANASASTETTQSAADLDPADYAAITALVKQINDSSRSVDGQQADLLTVVHPDFAAEQRACPAATVTIRLDPAYPDLRPDPTWTPAGATIAPSGSLYRLPALVEVYTAGLRTGTDLTLLRVSVLNGMARSFPLCLV